MFTARQVMCQALGGEESSHVPGWWKEHPGLGGSGSMTVSSCEASCKSEDLSEPQCLQPKNRDDDLYLAQLEGGGGLKAFLLFFFRPSIRSWMVQSLILFQD